MSSNFITVSCSFWLTPLNCWYRMEEYGNVKDSRFHMSSRFFLLTMLCCFFFCYFHWFVWWEYSGIYFNIFLWATVKILECDFWGCCFFKFDIHHIISNFVLFYWMDFVIIITIIHIHIILYIWSNAEHYISTYIQHTHLLRFFYKFLSSKWKIQTVKIHFHFHSHKEWMGKNHFEFDDISIFVSILHFTLFFRCATLSVRWYCHTFHSGREGEARGRE